MSQQTTLFLTFYEVLAISGASPEFVKREIAANFLPVHEPLPGFRRFLATAVTEWIFIRQDVISQNPRTDCAGGATMVNLLRDFLEPSGIRRLRRYAAGLVTHAIRIGELHKKPCAICSDPKAIAHHPDYSKPLAVIFLCKQHHARLHALLRRLGFDSKLPMPSGLLQRFTVSLIRPQKHRIGQKKK
jgi:hypothetical protein